MTWLRVSSLLLLLFTSSCLRHDPAAEQRFLITISRESPGTHWQSNHPLRADLNDDGKLDYALCGIDQQRIKVAVVLAPIEPRSKAHVLELAIGNVQKGVSQWPAEMTIESMDYDPKEMTGDNPPGFRSSRTGHGLKVSDQATDPVHLFWNHQTQTLDWWRL